MDKLDKLLLRCVTIVTHQHISSMLLYIKCSMLVSGRSWQSVKLVERVGAPPTGTSLLTVATILFHTAS